MNRFDAVLARDPNARILTLDDAEVRVVEGHREVRRIDYERRKSRLRNGRVTERERAAILKIFGWRCAACGKRMPKGMHLDHVRPLSRGGRHDVSNLQPLCPSCHAEKGNHIEDFRPPALQGHALRTIIGSRVSKRRS